jgi:hypothetical protein
LDIDLFTRAIAISLLCLATILEGILHSLTLSNSWIT